MKVAKISIYLKYKYFVTLCLLLHWMNVYYLIYSIIFTVLLNIILEFLPNKSISLFRKVLLSSKPLNGSVT